ncbi:MULTISPECIES: hypothetical protein [Burkholderia]|uniref:hypothetical protein n=1 Tax=Burkholderia TaxID=32008 RepID=UPI0005509D9D|nr:MULTISPECIES: hypothetical protein [Burkholderia]EKS9886068.1 hypothetical protein [Burkholderia pyrrocinia]EKS9892306.1 hypothetical protein [Burkholderia pyrrocinia]TDA42416.1 hypothetical protein EVG18_38100 [Burkholderia pyrrocinia]UOB60055.1 hypothetical protein MRS60_33620 [Burkholderia pyrrocinia]HDR9510608.1 hypothetical protein [Burkholderia cepacia]
MTNPPPAGKTPPSAQRDVREAFRHLKPVAAVGGGRLLTIAAYPPDSAQRVAVDPDAVTHTFPDDLGRHRIRARKQQAVDLPA